MREIDGRAYAQCPDCGEMLIRRRFGWGAVLPNEAPEIRRLRRPAEAPAPPPRPQPPAARVVGIAVPGEEIVAVDPLGGGPVERPAGLPAWVITGAWPTRDGQGARRIDPGHRIEAPPRRAALPGVVTDDPATAWSDAAQSGWTIDQPAALPEATVDGGAAALPVEAGRRDGTMAEEDDAQRLHAAQDGGTRDATTGRAAPPPASAPAAGDAARADANGEAAVAAVNADPATAPPQPAEAAAAAPARRLVYDRVAQSRSPAPVVQDAAALPADGTSWAAMLAASRSAPSIVASLLAPPSPPEPASSRPAPPIIDPPAPAPAPPPQPAPARSPSDLAAIAIQRLHGSAAGAHALARLALARERGDAAGVAYWQGIAGALAKQVVPGLRAGR